MRSPLFFILLFSLTLSLACVTVMGPAAETAEAPALPTLAAPTLTRTPVRPTARPTATPGQPPPTPLITVTPRSRMTATDPTTVRLDDGQWKLVEFFAFW